MKISNSKVVIIGAGTVGSTTAFSLIVQGICSEVVLIDKHLQKAHAEVLDLKHGIEFLNRNVHIKAGDYMECADADIVVITASIPMNQMKTRIDLLEGNIKVIDEVVDAVMATGFNSHIVVVTNPVDIISYYVMKKSGLPPSQVIGTGTCINSKNIIYITKTLAITAF
jgi:L-lactate dehydrogenase